jgi:general secretion pathway protein D
VFLPKVRLALLILLFTVPLSAVARETITLNLKDADITSVIATISELTGRNFIIDPRVKGKVTVISSKPLQPDEVWQVFLSILSIHGYSAIAANGVTKIIPEANAKQDAIPHREPGGKLTGDQYVTQVLTLNNIAAAQLVPILRPLLPQEAHLAAYPTTNVLIASASAENMKKLETLIRRIDQGSEREIELVSLKHASAEEVVRILTTLMQKGAKGAAGQAPTEGDFSLIADTRTNSVLVSGEKTMRSQLKDLIAYLDTPLENIGNTRVIYLRYAKAKDLAAVLGSVSKSLQDKSAPQGGAKPAASDARINIQADESTNALVITAPHDLMRDIEAVVRKLDIRRAQVLVRAIIAEISSERAAEFGVQWGYDGADNNSPIGLINFSKAGSSILGLASPIPSLGDGISLGLGRRTGDGARFGALVRALKGDADANILSTPTLVTMDNEEAEIVVGQNVPFVTGSYTSTGSSTTVTNPFQTIQRQDVGLTLKIKPQINEGDAVKLEVQQEVSSVSATASGASDLITNKRSLKTTVIVDDGSVLVLGGLIDEQIDESNQKVPLLGDIPLLGALFSYRRTEKRKRNLMVFLAPTILREDDRSLAISTDKYNYIRAEQMALRQRGVALMNSNASPLLPAVDELLRLPPPYQPSAEELQSEGAAVKR